MWMSDTPSRCASTIMLLIIRTSELSDCSMAVSSMAGAGRSFSSVTSRSLVPRLVPGPGLLPRPAPPMSKSSGREGSCTTVGSADSVPILP